MRRERFLIAVLWLSAMALLALWFFNMVYGFNLFTAAHWQYLSELQLSNGVDPTFYFSIAAFIVVGLAGLYLLIVPWHRKIEMRSTSIGLGMRPSIPAVAGTPSAIMSARPPKLNLGNEFIATRKDPIMTRAAPAPTPSPKPVSARPLETRPAPVSDERVDEVRRMLDNVGFISKKAPMIGDVKLDLWAIGTDEALVVGILSDVEGGIAASEGGDSMWRAGDRKFKSPVWQMTSAIQRLEALFMEILDPELRINILPFVLLKGKVENKDAVEHIWDALGVKVFDDDKRFAEFLSEYRPDKMDETQKENFGAFSEFVDTVSSYFGGK